MTALAAAIDALFADPNLARDALYQLVDGEPVRVRVMTRRADVLAEFGDARLWSETSVFDVRVSEVATPRPGDRIILGDETFIIQGEPLRDRERLVWTVEARPE